CFTKRARDIIGIPLLVVLFGAFAIYKAHSVGMETKNPASVGLYEAQVWAKENTPDNAKFITADNWRSVSQRAKIEGVPEVTTPLYTPYKKLKDRNDYLFELY